MKTIKDEKKFINTSKQILSNMIKRIDELNSLNINNIDPSKTLVFSIDLNNGFAKNGLMSSNRVKGLINDTKETLFKLANKGIQVVAYIDTHTTNSIELESYPLHCLKGTNECEIVDEIKKIPNLIIKEKNSTNGFIAANPLDNNEMNYPNLKQEELDKIDTFIISGDCTDICIYQFTMTLKNYLNQNNRKANVIIPINLIDTFDSDQHNADFMNIVFANSMLDNGIILVKDIIE